MREYCVCLHAWVAAVSLCVCTHMPLGRSGLGVLLVCVCVCFFCFCVYCMSVSFFVCACGCVCACACENVLNLSVGGPCACIVNPDYALC